MIELSLSQTTDWILLLPPLKISPDYFLTKLIWGSEEVLKLFWPL